MILAVDRSLHSLEDRTFGACRLLVILAVDRSLHSLEVLQGALRRSSNEVIFKQSDLQGLRPILKPKAIYKGSARSTNKVN